ncbi:MAG: hypothetical protein EA349_00950 [Halomonadaceae bacterium]|nr:MAG: hypothetical protein EA349_00950 [Halomonadaceae bacterium]
MKSVTLIIGSETRDLMPHPLWLAVTLDEPFLDRVLASTLAARDLNAPQHGGSCAVQWQHKKGFCADQAEVICTPHLFRFRSLNQLTNTVVVSRPVPVVTLLRMFRAAAHQETLFYSHDVAILKAIYFGTTRQNPGHRVPVAASATLG